MYMSKYVYIYIYIYICVIMCVSMYIISLILTGKPSRRDSNNQPGSDFNQHNITVDATTMIRNSGGW